LRPLDLRRRLSLLEDGRFRLLFVATFASGIGNWLAVIALQIDVYDRTHSGWWVGGLLIANILPAVFLGLLAGPLVDKLSRKGLMVGSDLGRLLVFVALPFADSATAVVLLAALAGIGNAFFRPAVLAGLPNLVPEAKLPSANALLQLVEWTTTAVGPIVGGAIVAALAEVGVEVWYWGTSIVRPYIAALLRLPEVTSGMEPHKYHMHSLRAFFELLGLSGSPAMAAYIVAAAATCVLALICWKRRGPLAVRFSVVVIATILVDPHLYAYDLVLLTPVFLLLWNWILAEPVRPLEHVAPWLARWTPGRSFTDAIVALIYFCYFAPLLATFADLGHVQVSVIAMVLLALLAAMGSGFRVPGSRVRGSRFGSQGSNVKELEPGTVNPEP